MSTNIRDIIQERLSKQSLSVSPKSTLEELENALIPYHEKLLSKAEKDMATAKSAEDATAHDEALKVYSRELGIIVKLAEKKLELLTQILGSTRKKIADSIEY